MQQKGLRRLFSLAFVLLLLIGCSSGVGDLPEGQITGSALKVQATITPRFGEPPTQQTPGYDEYVALEDDTGALYVEVPAEWDDVDTSPLTNAQGQVFAASIKASTDIASYDESYNVPAVHFIAFRVDQDFVVDDLLDEINFQACEYEGRQDYEDELYTGKYDRYTNCAGGDTTMLVVAATPPENDFVTLVVIQVVTEADMQAAERIANTFQVTGELPELQVPQSGSTPALQN